MIFKTPEGATQIENFIHKNCFLLFRRSPTIKEIIYDSINDTYYDTIVLTNVHGMEYNNSLVDLFILACQYNSRVLYVRYLGCENNESLEYLRGCQLILFATPITNPVLGDELEDFKRSYVRLSHYYIEDRYIRHTKDFSDYVYTQVANVKTGEYIKHCPRYFIEKQI